MSAVVFIEFVFILSPVAIGTLASLESKHECNILAVFFCVFRITQYFTVSIVYPCPCV